MSWSPNDIETLKSLWATHSAAIIGLQIDKTRNAVIGMSRRMGLPSKMTDPDIRKRLLSRQRRNPEFKPKPRLAVVKAEPAQHNFLGLEIWKLTRTTCRFPKGDGPFLFCGQPVKEGSSYCPHCHSMTSEAPRYRVRAA
jgi:hypothetical protein